MSRTKFWNEAVGKLMFFVLKKEEKRSTSVRMSGLPMNTIWNRKRAINTRATS